MGVGTGMDSHTCELSNKPWIIKNSYELSILIRTHSILDCFG